MTISQPHQPISSVPALESTYMRREKIFAFVREGVVDGRVLELLTAGGKAILDESMLWDFKKELPIAPKDVRLSDSIKRALDAKFCEIIKDCVAFYNSFGGYLIIGVDDGTREITGFEAQFDAADLNKRIFGATFASIETVYRTLVISSGERQLSVGLLFVPQRPDDQIPVQFRKNATESDAGRLAYRSGDFYLRERDNCIPATTTEQLEFLFGRGRRTFGNSGAASSRVLEENLPPRDPDMGMLIGRDDEISELWLWLTDSFSPIKILCGLGGVGKTSIAYSFAQRVAFQAPAYIDKVIWLSAKQTTYSALKGARVDTARVDFDNISSFLVKFLLELGCPAEQIPDDAEDKELLEIIDSHLGAFRYLVVIDDVDTLEDDEQQHLLHLSTQLFSRARAKGIITARRNLGTSKPTHSEIEGLKRDPFQKFVEEKCELLQIKAKVADDPVLMDEFFIASGGSPLFVLSILRLISLGDPPRDAIRNWKGADGEAVREAAFKREVGRLKADEARALLALCYLRQTSAIELSAVLKLNRYEVLGAIETLQGFSMTRRNDDLPGGATLEIPPALAQMAELIETRIPDRDDIRQACRELRQATDNKTAFVSSAVRRSIAFLRQSDARSAETTVREALAKLPEDPDLLCLLGRCLSELGPSSAAQAEDVFQQAADRGCRKRELYEGWIALRLGREDWKGVVEISRNAEKNQPSARYPVARNNARLALADNRASAGHFQDAETLYLESLEDILNAINTYYNSPERPKLVQLKSTLVLRWLGAINAITGETNQPKRFFGACVKALTRYRFYDPAILASALGRFSNWVSTLESRRILSETAVDQIQTERRRLSTLETHLKSKVSGGVGAILLENVEEIAGRLERLSEKHCGSRRGVLETA